MKNYEFTATINIQLSAADDIPKEKVRMMLRDFLVKTLSENTDAQIVVNIRLDDSNELLPRT